MPPEDETRRFRGEIEIHRTFKSPGERAVADIEYCLEDGHPRFLSVSIDDKRIPLKYIPESSLLQAFSRRRSR